MSSGSKVVAVRNRPRPRLTPAYRRMHTRPSWAPHTKVKGRSVTMFWNAPGATTRWSRAVSVPAAWSTADSAGSCGTSGGGGSWEGAAQRLTIVPNESGEHRRCNRLTRFASVVKVTPRVFSLSGVVDGRRN